MTQTDGRFPQALLFDLFHTLVDVKGVPGPSSSEVLGIDPVEWNRALMSQAEHHALGLEADPYESIRKIVHAIDPAIPEERIRLVVEARPRRFRHALTRVRPEILAGVCRLVGLGLPLGLISNAGFDEVEAWPDSPLAPHFQATLFSCHEKRMKPDPEIYRRGAARLGVSPERCLFVGDGGSREHEGARAVGMRTVLFLALLQESSPELAAQRPRNTDFVIESMDGLVGLVEDLLANRLDLRLD